MFPMFAVTGVDLRRDVGESGEVAEVSTRY